MSARRVRHAGADGDSACDRQSSLRVHTVDSRTPSPFAAALLFSYVANYIYDGDAPLAERRAQALSIDQDQLRELMGDADLRELLDLSAIEETEEQLQCLAETYKARTMDGVHDLLLKLGDLRRDELLARCVSPEIALTVERLRKVLRILEVSIAGEKRLIAVEDAGGIATRWACPCRRVCRRRSRWRCRMRRLICCAATAHARAVYDGGCREALWAGDRDGGGGAEPAGADGARCRGRVSPGGQHREWCDHEVLRTIRRKSLARLRKEVEPVEQATLARLFTRWQGVVQPRRGLDALLDVIENLQGAPMPASMLEAEVLPARLLGYKSADLDTLIAAGEVVWCGLEPIGEKDGRIALYLAEKLPVLWPVGRGDGGGAGARRRSGSKAILRTCRARRELLPGSARRHGRRVSGRDAGVDLEPGVARAADQRRAACAAGLRRTHAERAREREAAAPRA